VYVPFDTLPDHSRIWIYQSNRRLDELEVISLASELEMFCRQWAAHGEPLRSSYRIEHNQFVILCADEDYHAPSGCSIDTSVRVLKDFQSRVGADFFDRSLVAFLEGEQVTSIKLGDLKEKFASGALKGSTITFDNLVPSKGDLLRRWTVPAEKTWLAKYLGKSALAS
jgi:hypothetical protein